MIGGLPLTRRPTGENGVGASSSPAARSAASTHSRRIFSVLARRSSGALFCIEWPSATMASSSCPPAQRVHHPFGQLGTAGEVQFGMGGLEFDDPFLFRFGQDAVEFAYVKAAYLDQAGDHQPARRGRRGGEGGQEGAAAQDGEDGFGDQVAVRAPSLRMSRK